LRRPLIGITTYHREREGRPRFTLPDAYVNAVRAAGGLPVLLPPGEEAPEDILPRLDGIVLAGGGDLDPSLFGGAAHPSTYFVCSERDAFEVALVRAALAREVPTLAVCRGAQVLNVALGGDVHVHLEDVVGCQVRHRASQDAHVYHPVTLEPGSRLAALFAREELPAVPSWHHQAVRRLGEGLLPVAFAPDGTVEALELREAPFLTAVQWHPELEIGPGSPQRLLFAALVRDAAARSDGGGD
jgi:putative glutamine amidotransferase